MATATKKETTFLEALVQARSEMPDLAFDSANPFHKNKYISLAGVIEGVTPVLNKHGIIITHQVFRAEDGNPWVRTSLVHVSGDRLDSDMPLMGKSAQEIGSALTYAKRYSLLGLTAMTAGDIDDDAEAVTAPTRGSAAPKGPSEAQNKLIKTLLKSVRGATSKADGDAVVNELVGKTLDNLTVKDATTLIDALKDEQKSKGGAFS